MVNLLVAAAALAAASPDAPPPLEEAEPAMFMVRDADTTVYIFGTFHALDGQADWFNGEVKSAFDQSRELVLETVLPHDPQPGAARGAAAPQPQFRPPSVTPGASFLATTRMAINAGRSQGMSVGNGADMVLRRAADAAGKQVDGLETLESQLAMFVRMPPPAARAATAKGTDAPMEGLTRAMVEMQSAWKQGDQQIFVYMLDQLRRNAPDTYRVMFTERNSRWADWVAGRMQTPGTVFVAVGAGHFAGKDSVLVKLAERGIPSARVN